MTTRTRFAPSPSGDLHLGGARTALFCWAFARHCEGEFLLRIEDTDAARSTQQSIDSIIAALDWIGLSPDAPPVYQSRRREEHRRLAVDLVQRGAAYYCYAAPAELDALRQSQIAAGQTPRYDRRWRDSKKTPPRGIEPAIRLKTPLAGRFLSSISSKAKPPSTNVELDDPVVLRADGSPTYNFACAADDAQMKITHVARGDDHVRNTLRQLHIFAALGEAPPRYAHLPLIFNAAKDDDGNLRRAASGEIVYERMSKRNGAVDVLSYRAAGYLPEALVNYLARLGFSFPDSREIFSMAELAAAFDFRRAQKSPARFDPDKLRRTNREYLQKRPTPACAIFARPTPRIRFWISSSRARRRSPNCATNFRFSPPRPRPNRRAPFSPRKSTKTTAPRFPNCGGGWRRRPIRNGARKTLNRCCRKPRKSVN